MALPRLYCLTWIGKVNLESIKTTSHDWILRYWVMFCKVNVCSFLFHKEDLEYKIVELSRALLSNCEILTRFAVLRLCCMCHYAVCCFGSGCRCNLYGFPGEALSFLFSVFSNKYRNLSHWNSLLICLGGEIYSFVVLCFLFSLFLFSET